MSTEPEPHQRAIAVMTELRLGIIAVGQASREATTKEAQTAIAKMASQIVLVSQLLNQPLVIAYDIKNKDTQ
jgi:hypothetical protein